ncbi:MAG: hypothetical protein HOW71_26160 [Nonomuraea sp.]|nr:hypothetical protein [Nonomuraea sp.]
MVVPIGKLLPAAAPVAGLIPVIVGAGKHPSSADCRTTSPAANLSLRRIFG